MKAVVADADAASRSGTERRLAKRRPTGVSARGSPSPAVSIATNAAARGFEKTLEAAIGIVLYERRLRGMGGEVRKATRRINVLTETILPRF